MLSITDEVKTALAWFDHCHRFEPDALGRKRWVRTALPRVGGMADQEARLMDALDWLLEIHQKLTPAPMAAPPTPPRGRRV